MTARRPAVVFQPRAGASLQRGTRALTALLKPTIGPHPRAVASSTVGSRAPELLDDGGLIARRLIQLPDRDEDVGAMFLRGLLWRVYEHAGDGVATTGVLFQAIFDGGLHAIAAGVNAMRLRHFLHAGLSIVLDHLSEQTIAVDCQNRLTQAALTVCADPDLAEHLGQIFAVLGEHGQIELRSGQSRGLASDLIEGSYWEAPPLATTLLAGAEARRIELERALIFISDLDIDDPHALVPLLTLARREGAGALVVLARKLAAPCNAVLTANSGPAFRAIGVRTPGIGPPDRHVAACQDLEALTEGRTFRSQAGDAVDRVDLADLGRARRAWVDRQHLGIVGPGGDPHRLRAHVRELRRRHGGEEDAAARAELSQRLARLSGAAALLWVGGATTPAIDQRKALARRTAAAVRGALQSGVLPGGGVALLACREPLAARLALAVEPEERAAYRILLRAMEEPARAIIANSGHDGGHVLAAIERAGAGRGLNAETGEIVDVAAAGIVDVAPVVRLAVRTAVEGAAQALTIDTLVHPRKPVEATAP
jgi:chaperonin GroEL